MATQPLQFHNVENIPIADRVLFSQFGRGPSVPIPYRVVHHAFEAITDEHPGHLAVRHHDGATITYSQLEHRANSLANLLVSKGLKRGNRVCCVYSRGIHMVAAILAVLKAGGQYVPLDGGVVSEESLEHIFKDTGAQFVLCLDKHKGKVLRNLPETNPLVFSLDGPDSEETLWCGDVSRPDVGSQPEDGTYIIYTSGTTGKPKGVDVKHDGVTNTLLAEPSKLGITVGKNVAQVLSVSFDMGAWEVLVAMMNGGTLHIRGRDDWADCLKRVDTVIATPSVLGRFRQADFPNIKNIAVGGEPCPLALAEEWASHANFWNVCGPTEISILNTGHLHKPGRKLSIGKPNPNTNVYVLDEDENPVPIGEPGLMWVGGVGVSRGYVNLPELTAARYKADKFTLDGKMMFNTGDLGRWLQDGGLEHLGRRDDQVKIKGFRVELDGVSAAIERFPTITKACALLIGDTLWGFYAGPSAVSHDELGVAMSAELPYYAVPGKWFHQTSLPLTNNGKVDKRSVKRLVKADVPSPETLAPSSPVVNSPQPDFAFGARTDVQVVATKPASDPENGSKDGIGATEEAMESPDSEDNGEKYQLPEEHGLHGGRWLRHRVFSLYRRSFSIISIANAIAFFVIVDKAVANKTSLSIPHLATAVAANVLVSVLMRQDHVINLLFWAATRVPVTAPFFIRRLVARVYHITGVHSGCAISATMWWILFTVAATISFFNPGPTNKYPINGLTLALTYSILGLLVSIVVVALPRIREAFHNSFEWTHSLAGWTAIALMWAHLVATLNSTNKAGKPLAELVTHSPAFYILILITASIVLPWLSLRHVKVRPEPLSNHAVRLHFDFTITPSDKGIRIANHPLMEGHVFAAINKPGVRGFSIIVSNAGDWTRNAIDNPPTSIWVKGVTASGVLAIAHLFCKVVLVATGPGIGPFLPLILERKIPVRVLWSTPNPEETFGQDIVDAVLKADPEAVIWNPRTQGKPDLARMAHRMYRESNCECVAVISNNMLTQQLVYRMETRGIPCFGPVFDS
ncbi:Adenylate-forming reductase [Zalerion maritima]|uniref:Adenylate-forming reductase n=1 Tax=Zalerion maritima TaxID=339359 RepID=A0AAD5WU13_9PEZI|nr:Adenylate-forming reductase [Zalerion maritima]